MSRLIEVHTAIQQRNMSMFMHALADISDMNQQEFIAIANNTLHTMQYDMLLTLHEQEQQQHPSIWQYFTLAQLDEESVSCIERLVGFGYTFNDASVFLVELFKHATYKEISLLHRLMACGLSLKDSGYTAYQTFALTPVINRNDIQLLEFLAAELTPYDKLSFSVQEDRQVTVETYTCLIQLDLHIVDIMEHKDAAIRVYLLKHIKELSMADSYAVCQLEDAELLEHRLKMGLNYIDAFQAVKNKRTIILALFEQYGHTVDHARDIVRYVTNEVNKVSPNLHITAYYEHVAVDWTHVANRLLKMFSERDTIQQDLSTLIFYALEQATEPLDVCLDLERYTKQECLLYFTQDRAIFEAAVACGATCSFHIHNDWQEREHCLDTIFRNAPDDVVEWLWAYYRLPTFADKFTLTDIKAMVAQNAFGKLHLIHQVHFPLEHQSLINMRIVALLQQNERSQVARMLNYYRNVSAYYIKLFLVDALTQNDVEIVTTFIENRSLTKENYIYAAEIILYFENAAAKMMRKALRKFDTLKNIKRDIAAIAEIENYMQLKDFYSVDFVLNAHRHLLKKGYFVDSLLRQPSFLPLFVIHGFDIERVYLSDEGYTTLLMLAVQQDNQSVIDELLELGAQCEQLDYYFISPLEYALQNKQYALIELFCQQQLSMAAATTIIESVVCEVNEKLLQQVLPLLAQDAFLSQALCMAFNDGQYNMAKLLMEHGATLLFKDTPQYQQANEWEQVHFNYIDDDFYFYDCVFLRKSANKAIHYKHAEKKSYQSIYDLLQQFGMTHEEERYVFEFAIEYDWPTMIEKYKNENFLLLRPVNYYYRGSFLSMSMEKLTYLHGLNGSTSWRIEPINTYTQVNNDSLLFLLRHCESNQFDDIDSVVHYLAEHAVLAGFECLQASHELTDTSRTSALVIARQHGHQALLRFLTPLAQENQDDHLLL